MELPPEVETGCANARELVRLCDVIQAGPVQLEDLHSFGERAAGEHFHGEYDPDVDPYFWDL